MTKFAGDRVTGDDDRVRLATWSEERGMWVGPTEKERCPHGRIYSFRWVWFGSCDLDSIQHQSEPEFVKCGCSLCAAEGGGPHFG